MSGFGGNVSKKSNKKSKKDSTSLSKVKSKGKGRKNRNLNAVAKFKAGDDFAMMELAMQYQLEETLKSGSYY